MTVLPSGWVEARVDEVSEVRLGRQRSPKNHKGARMRPYIRAANVTWRGLDLNDVKEMNFSESESLVYELHPGDVVLAEASGSASEVGKPAIWRGEIRDCCFQNTLIRVRSHGVDPSYLRAYFFAQARSGRLGGESRGVGIHHIGSQRLASWRIPLPPLDEQRRIVAAIEEQSSRLDAADLEVRRAARRFARLHESVFASAVRDWPRRPLAGLLREPLRNGHSAKAADGGGVRTLTLTAVTRGDFSDPFTKLTNADPERVKDLWLRSGDVLIERSNTPELVGTAALFRGPEGWAIFPDLLIRIRVSAEILPEYLEIALKAPETRHYFRAAAQGIAGSMPKIDQGSVERLMVPLPSLEEQQRIVAEVEQRLSVIDAMSNAITSAQRRSEALRRSILERAFRGELVPQDPSDEPASVLLDRIRAERAAQPKIVRTRRRAGPVPAP